MPMRLSAQDTRFSQPYRCLANQIEPLIHRTLLLPYFFHNLLIYIYVTMPTLLTGLPLIFTLNKLQL